jgi:hypothetical protein
VPASRLIVQVGVRFLAQIGRPVQNRLTRQITTEFKKLFWASASRKGLQIQLTTNSIAETAKVKRIRLQEMMLFVSSQAEPRLRNSLPDT